MSQITQKTSVRLLNGFFENELNEIKQAQKTSIITSEHQEYAFAVAWGCFIFKDLVAKTFKNKLNAIVDELLSENGYDWIHIPGILAASYILNKNTKARNSLLQQVSHRTSGTQDHIIMATGALAPFLSFNNRYLRESVVTNIERSQLFYREATVLYLCTKGLKDAKRQWALQAKQQFNESKDHQAFFKELFKKNEYYQNGYFGDACSTAKSHFVFKLLANPLIGDVQADLFEATEEVQTLVHELQQREKNHHLSRSYIDLSCLKEEKNGLFK